MIATFNDQTEAVLWLPTTFNDQTEAVLWLPTLKNKPRLWDDCHL